MQPIAARGQPPFNVFLVGPSSTGKTHHLNELQVSLGSGANFYFGIAREILKKRGITGDDLVRDPELHMQLQRELVEKYSVLQQQQETKNGGPIIRVFDRCGIDALVYARRYVRAEDAAALQASTKFQSCLDLYRNRQRSLVVLFPVVPELLKSDGVRIHGNVKEQEKMFNLFKSTMQELNIPFVVLGTDLEGRGNWLVSRICSSAQLEYRGG